MSEYRVERLKRDVRIQLASGDTLEGQMFLRPGSRHRARPEEPAELLNDVEPFFPLLLEEGKTMLVAKSSVAVAETDSMEGEEPDFTSLGYSVVVTLTDRSTRRGSVFVARQPGRERLFDFLNAFPSRFLPLYDVDKLTLINTQLIAHVREVE